MDESSKGTQNILNLVYHGNAHLNQNHNEIYLTSIRIREDVEKLKPAL